MADEEEPTTEEGRIAWTQRGKDNGTSYYTLAEGKDRIPRDGSMNWPDTATNETKQWYYAVHLGVMGIQQLLFDLELLDPEAATGVFGGRTFKAVKNYQRSTGLVADGKVGMRTMERILHPVISEQAHQQDVNPKWVYGIARQESALDPGAQGWQTPHDFGVWQHNTSLSVTPEEACDVKLACKLAVNRWVMAREKFGDKGHTLQVDCCIMQHRSPVAAEYLYDHETPFGPESDKYVKDVRAFAEQWR